MIIAMGDGVTRKQAKREEEEEEKGKRKEARKKKNRKRKRIQFCKVMRAGRQVGKQVGNEAISHQGSKEE